MALKIGIVGLPNVGKSTLFNALTRTAAAQAANFPVLHHRAERRRGERAGRAPRPAGGDREVGEGGAGADHLRRHRRARAGRQQGRGARQPVPRQYPRVRRHRPRAALLRGRRRHPCRGPGRSGRRRRDGGDRADAGRPRERGEAARRAAAQAQGRRQGGGGAGAAARGGEGGAGGRAAGADGDGGRGGRADLAAAAAPDREAGALRLQRRGGGGRDRQRLLRGGGEDGRGRGGGVGGDLGGDRGGDRPARRRRAGGVSSRRWACTRPGSTG